MLRVSPSTPPAAPAGAAPRSGDRRWRRLVLLLPLLAAVGLAAGWLVDPGSHQSLVQYVDDLVRAHVLAYRTPALEHLLHPVLWLAGPFHVLPLAAVASLVLFLLRRRWQALVPLVAVAGTDLLVFYLKVTIARPGPAGTGLAFPSGHTSGITALVVPLAVLAWTTKRWWWPTVVAALLIALVGSALLVLDDHWLSDIVAGALLTGAWSAAVAAWLPEPRHRTAVAPQLAEGGPALVNRVPGGSAAHAAELAQRSS